MHIERGEFTVSLVPNGIWKIKSRKHISWVSNGDSRNVQFATADHVCITGKVRWGEHGGDTQDAMTSSVRQKFSVKLDHYFQSSKQ